MNTHLKTAALAVVAAATLVSCGSPAGDAASKPESVTSKSPTPTSAGLTAEAASKKLAEAIGVTSLGDPQDNTSGCSNRAADREPHENDCRQLITTNMVSIYEFATPKVAAHWVKEMSRVGDWRQVDRFTLSWTARDQKLTSEDRRDELEKAMKKIAAEES